MTDVGTRKLDAHIWEREEHEHYVEPEWVSRRLFEVENFHPATRKGSVYDPCCGFGRIPEAAHKAGYATTASDIVDRGYHGHAATQNFLTTHIPGHAIVCNPPFDLFANFAHHALSLANKVAMIWLVPRLNAARWLQQTPLARVYLLTPRPSMPPGHVITKGEKPGGGTQDFCWLVWDRGYVGKPELQWLHRDASGGEPWRPK